MLSTEIELRVMLADAFDSTEEYMKAKKALKEGKSYGGDGIPQKC